MSKLCVYLSIKASPGEKIPGKLFSLIILFRMGRGGLNFFKKICGKNRLLAKIVSRVIRTWLNASRGSFWGKTCISKNFSDKYNFSNIQHNFSFLSFFWRFIKKASLCPDEIIEEIFLRSNICLRIFSRIWADIVILRQHNFNRLSKMRFICLEQIFHGDFFTWKVLSNWITFFGNWAFCSWNLGTKLRTIFEQSFSIIAKTGL